jgi:DNA-binding transcriptional LysR family regulator
MDINRIRYFLTLAQTGHLGQAAELHLISAPAFSKAMKIFADECGVELFVPQGRGILLTDQARALVPALQDIVERIDNLRKPVELGERIRIASFEVFSTYFMEEMLAEYFPDKRVLLLEMTPGKMEAAVVSREVDFAITYNPIPHQDLDFLKIQRIEMGIFGKKLNLPFVIPVGRVDGSPSKVRGLDGWPDDKFPRKVQYEVELMETALGICRKGLAVAYLPKFVVRMHNQKVKADQRLEEFSLPAGLMRVGDYVYLVKRKSDSEGNVAKKISAAIRKLSSLT